MDGWMDRWVGGCMMYVPYSPQEGTCCWVQRQSRVHNLQRNWQRSEDLSCPKCESCLMNQKQLGSHQS